MKHLVTLCVALLLLATPCLAQTVTLVWDLSLSEPLGTGGGYKCYTSKNSQVYGATPAGTVAPGINTVTLTGLPYGRSFFVCTAFVQDGTESDYSNEVSTVIKPKPPKLTTVQQVAQVLTAPIRGITKLAGLMRRNKGLRIVPQ